jgi:hypothetical protein
MRSSSGSQKGPFRLGFSGSTSTATSSARAGLGTRISLRACSHTTTMSMATLLIVRIPRVSYWSLFTTLIESIKLVVDNWREHVASDVDAPPGHFRNPYPVPTWAVRPSHLSSLARALPDSLPHTPRPSPSPLPSPPSRTPTNAQREEAKQEPGYTSRRSPFRGSLSRRVEAVWVGTR